MVDRIVAASGDGLGAPFATDYETIEDRHHPSCKVMLGINNEFDGFWGVDNPGPMQDAYVSPKLTYGKVTLAPGSSGLLDSVQITAGKTAKLVSVICWGSRAYRAFIKTVLDGTESGVNFVIGSLAGGTPPLWLPRGFVSVAHSAGVGFDGFRALVENLDIGNSSSDIHVTFLYDEI